MSISKEVSGKILGQISLMQSVVLQLPDRDSMLNFVCRGLKDVSGVETVEYRPADQAEGSPALPAGAADPQPSLRRFAIEYKDRRYAELLFTITDPDAFSPYTPFIENFSNMLGVVFEEQHQRGLNRSIMDDLEARVRERTHALEAEIAERIRTEKALRSEKEFTETALNAGISSGRSSPSAGKRSIR